MNYLLGLRLRILFLALFVCIAGKTTAQIYYGYDTAGNRTSKTITLSSKTMKKMVRPDSLEMAESVAIATYFDEPQNDAIGQTEIKIYPNPTKGALRVDIIGTELTTDDRIEVFDSNGRLVKIANSLDESNLIDLSEAKNGIYIMLISIGGESTSWRIIKE